MGGSDVRPIRRPAGVIKLIKNNVIGFRELGALCVYSWFHLSYVRTYSIGRFVEPWSMENRYHMCHTHISSKVDFYM